MKKKTFAALTAAIVAAQVVLAGCAATTDTAAAPAADAATETTQQATTDAPETATEKTVIKVGTNGGPTPYVTIDENNEFGGSDIEILQAVFERLPQYELDLQASDGALPGVLAGQYDFAVGNFGWRDERGETYYYSLPYKTSAGDVYIQRIDDEPLTGLQDLADRGYKTEVGAGSLKASALEAWNEENPDHQIEIVYSDADFALKFQHVVDGVTDVAIDDGPILDALIDQFGYTDQLVGNEIDEETQAFISPKSSSYFLFTKDEKGAALREDIDGAIKELKEDGTLAEILTKYFGKDTSPSAEDLESTPN